MAATVTNPVAADLRSLSDEELLTRLREAKEELFNLRFQVATGQLDNNARLRSVRRSIGRIYTVMRERELGITYVAVSAADQEAALPVSEVPSETEPETEPETEAEATTVAASQPTTEASSPEASSPEASSEETP
jgi:large subunit ribosomal protein L29